MRAPIGASLAVLVAAVACGAATGNAQELRTGLHGLVTKGPLSPVCSDQTPCEGAKHCSDKSRAATDIQNVQLTFRLQIDLFQRRPHDFWPAIRQPGESFVEAFGTTVEKCTNILFRRLVHFL